VPAEGRRYIYGKFWENLDGREWGLARLVLFLFLFLVWLLCVCWFWRDRKPSSSFYDDYDVMNVMDIMTVAMFFLKCIFF